MFTVTSTDARLRVEGLSVSYRRRGEYCAVLQDVSFEIASGQALGLVGESGCGKTTVAMALMRYLPRSARLDSGMITFEGQDVLALDPKQLRAWRGKRMAMVYQEPGAALNPAMRVGEQIAEVVRFHEQVTWQIARRRAQDMVAKVALGDHERVLASYPHQLSGGQQQRIVIAMALACDPGLLILDEPTTGLDATVEAEVLELIATLRSEFNTAILFISHNLGLVARMCDQVVVLYAGRVVEQGAARPLFAAPAHPYTTALVGCVPDRHTTKLARRLVPIAGALPALGANLRGCQYHPRCPHAQARCVEVEPALVSGPGARAVRCHFVDEIRRADAASPGPAPPPQTVPAAEPSEPVPVLEVHELRTQYKDVVACDRVSFSVNRGEIFGLVGESGSGKSSLALTLAGLVERSGGRVDYAASPLASKVSRRSPSVRREIQMVFQNPDTTLNPKHKVRYVLARAIKLLSGPRDVVDLAATVRLQRDQLEAKANQLSGGQKQRVAIARAFAGQPRLVLCDEPVSSLDVSVQAVVLNLLVDLQAALDVAYIFVSHDLAVVAYLADRIGVMYAGQLIEVGDTKDVFSPPHHPYTAALLSAIPTLDLDSPEERIHLRGEVANLRNPPSGCRFHPRCPNKIGPICETDAPPWQDAGSGHRIRCHYASEQLVEIQSRRGGGDIPDSAPHASSARPA